MRRHRNEGDSRSIGLCVLSAVAAMAIVCVWGAKASAEDCVEHGLSVETLSEPLEQDVNVKGMKPWELKSIVFEPCAVGGQLPLVMTYWTPERTSKLGLTYQLVLTVPFDVTKKKVAKMDPVPSRIRGAVEKSIRGLEKDPLAAGIVANATGVGAVAHEDGRIELIVPEWGEEPALEWTGEAVQRARVAGAVEIATHPQIVAFRAVAPTSLVEGKDCGLPKVYDMVQDGRDWLFQFSLAGACKGDWVLRIAEDGTVTSEKE